MAERLASAFVIPSNFTIHEVPTVPPGAAIAAAVPRLDRSVRQHVQRPAGDQNGGAFRAWIWRLLPNATVEWRRTAAETGDDDGWFAEQSLDLFSHGSFRPVNGMGPVLLHLLARDGRKWDRSRVRRNTRRQNAGGC
jgi:hypothetical protein